jgi:hypothetical protein
MRLRLTEFTRFCEGEDGFRIGQEPFIREGEPDEATCAVSEAPSPTRDDVIAPPRAAARAHRQPPENAFVYTFSATGSQLCNKPEVLATP